jgi:hypothetical protein
MQEMNRLEELFKELNETLYHPAGLSLVWPKKTAFLFVSVILNLLPDFPDLYPTARDRILLKEKCDPSNFLLGLLDYILGFSCAHSRPTFHLSPESQS